MSISPCFSAPVLQGDRVETVALRARIQYVLFYQISVSWRTTFSSNTTW